jgi:putative ABC transport system ATP-binding protein
MPNPTLASIVHCQRLTHLFRTDAQPIRAVDDVSLSIMGGELTLLTGPSGCGKTTLISIIAGLLRQTEGTVSILGQSLQGLSQRAILQLRLHKIGFIFQQFNLLTGLTATENVAVPLIAAGVSRSIAAQRASDILDELGLADRRTKYPKQLSGGQQQRVAIARALVHEPSLVLCDEPTAALDSQSGYAVMQLLKRLAVQPNRAALIVTHDPRIFEFGDRVITMEDGKVIEEARTPSLPSPLKSGERGARINGPNDPNT